MTFHLFSTKKYTYLCSGMVFYLDTLSSPRGAYPKGGCESSRESPDKVLPLYSWRETLPLNLLPPPPLSGSDGFKVKSSPCSECLGFSLNLSSVGRKKGWHGEKDNVAWTTRTKIVSCPLFCDEQSD